MIEQYITIIQIAESVIHPVTILLSVLILPVGLWAANVEQDMMEMELMLVIVGV